MSDYAIQKHQSLEFEGMEFLVTIILGVGTTWDVLSSVWYNQ